MLYSSAFIKQCVNLFDDTKDHLDETQAKIKDLFNEIDEFYLSCDWEINHWRSK